MRITKLERRPDGVWQANASNDGHTVTMTNDHGVWGTPPDKGYRKLAMPFVAEALQRKLPREERGKR